MRFLVFRLYGPMASWGEIAVAEMRPSALHPTRSALLGLIGAALGLRREDEAHEELARPLRFGVLVESAGVPLADYHTAQALPARRGRTFATRADQLRGRRDELATILSRRDYRCDAAYRIAAWLDGPAPRFGLERLAEALARPVFTLYLGRKSCPLALPLGSQVVVAGSLFEALQALPPPPFRLPAGRRGSPDLGLFWEGEPGAGGPAAENAFTRRDDPVSRTRRSFRVRQESFTSIPESAREEDDDVPEPTEPLP